MDILRERVARLELLLAAQSSTDKPPVIDTIAQLSRSLATLVSRYPALSSLTAPSSVTPEDTASANAHAVIVLAHAHDFAILTSALPALLTLSTYASAPPLHLLVSDTAADIASLTSRIAALDSTISSLILRTITLLDRLYSLSVVDVNAAWVDLEDRLVATELAINTLTRERKAPL
ncbi:uncharacterized protein V1518DRAFT_421718 [Limtongia smithiae]|uniref:uncharacterized protein n=1 Tax=Limtongia smithiae TaxID=1125753 RepID=UPI0034CE0AB4